MQYIEDAVEALTLNRIQCLKCKGFLSIEPIFIDIETTRNICGRCVPNSALLERNPTYEILARQFTFPCAFIKRGCAVTSSFDMAASHENSCPYRTFTCFCLWFGNVFDFIKHVEEAHKNITIQANVTITINKCIYYLLKYQRLYFWVTCFYLRTMLHIRIQGITIASEESEATFSCKEIGSNMNTEITLNTLTKLNCTDTLMGRFTLSVNVSNDYLNNVSKRIICPTCFIQMTPPILNCSNGHTTCVECLGAWLDYCQVCSSESEFICNTELQCIALSLTFVCKWNCGNFFTSNYIREHEQSCALRIYDCWHVEDCNWRGYLNDLIVHDATCLAFVYGTSDSCLFNVNTPEVSFPGTISRRTIYHLVVFNCCFNMILDRQRNGTVIYVNEYDIYGFSWFRFQAVLEHVEENNCIFNREYDIQSSAGGIYKVNIPESDIMKFDSSQLYNIKVRVIRLDKDQENICIDNLYKHFKNYSKLHNE